MSATHDADTPRCEECGQPVPVGAWPFCASKANPEGHARGTYRWGLKSNLSRTGWQHTGTRSPR